MAESKSRFVPTVPVHYVTLQQLKERKERELQRQKEEELARRKEEEERTLKEESEKKEEEERKLKEASLNANKPINRPNRTRQRGRPALGSRGAAGGDNARFETVNNLAKNSKGSETLIADFPEEDGQRQKTTMMTLAGVGLRNPRTEMYGEKIKGVRQIRMSKLSIGNSDRTETYDEKKNKNDLQIAVSENPKSTPKHSLKKNQNPSPGKEVAGFSRGRSYHRKEKEEFAEKDLVKRKIVGNPKPSLEKNRNPQPDREVPGCSGSRGYRLKEKEEFVEKDLVELKIVGNQHEDRCVSPIPETDKSVKSASVDTKPEIQTKKKKNKGSHRKRYIKKPGKLAGNSENPPAGYEDEMLGEEGGPIEGPDNSSDGKETELVVTERVDIPSGEGGEGFVKDEKEEVSVRLLQKGMEEMRMHFDGADKGRRSLGFHNGDYVNKRIGEPKRVSNAGNSPNRNQKESIVSIGAALQIPTAEGEVVEDKKEEVSVEIAQKGREEMKVTFNGGEREHRLFRSRNQVYVSQRFGVPRRTSNGWNRSSEKRVSLKWVKKEDLN